MGKIIHPSCTNAIWSPSNTELEYNSKYQALESQSSLHKQTHTLATYVSVSHKVWDCVIVYIEQHELCLFHVKCRDDPWTCTKVYNILSFSSSNTIRIECGSCSIVNPFNLWQTFEPKYRSLYWIKDSVRKKWDIDSQWEKLYIHHVHMQYEVHATLNWITTPNIKHYRFNLLCIIINSYTGTKCMRFSNYGIV